MPVSSRSSGLGLLYRPLTLFKWIIYLCLPVLFWIAAHVQLISDFFTAQAVRNRNRSQVAQLEVRYAKLAMEKADLQSGGFAAEDTLRTRYKMRKRDEKVIIIEEEPLIPAAAVGATPVEFGFPPPPNAPSQAPAAR